ncbi:MAG: hypothetical protein ABI273_20275 [Lacunisphaera sp.]
MNFHSLVGILPALIFPTATLLQIVRIVRDRSTLGVSKTTWLLFGLANVALYLYTERYAEWQAIASLLFTAVLDFAIVALALFAYRSRVAPCS